MTLGSEDDLPQRDRWARLRFYTALGTMPLIQGHCIFYSGGTN
jgi:hypothetical protein